MRIIHKAKSHLGHFLPLSSCAFAFLLSSCSSPDLSPTSAGYKPPALSGWQQDEPGAKGYDPDSTTYRKRVSSTKIRMKFSLFAPRDGKPDDLAALKKDAESGLAFARTLSEKLQVVEQKETTFRSFPAFLTRTQDTIHNNKRERKILRVADGKNTFLIDQTLTGPKIADSARREADAAWETISKGLKIEAPNGS